MPQLVATILGAILMAAIAVNVQHRFQENLMQTVYHNEVFQAARQQASFSRSIAAYLAANTVSSGTILSPAEMEASNLLAPGFPLSNPFGQTSVAYVGSNDSVIVTYSGLPTQSNLTGFNLSTSSVINMKALSYEEASDIAAMQAGNPNLTGGMLYAGLLSTPFEGAVLSASNFVPAGTLPAGPLFADLINVLSVPTLSSPSQTGYGAVTGD